MDFPTRTHTLRGWLAGALVLAATTACSKAKESTADWKADQSTESATVPATADSLVTERMDTMSSGGTAAAGQPADPPAKPRAEPDPTATVPQAAPDSAPARSTLDTLSRMPTDSATPADSASWTEAENRDTTIETIDSTPDSAAVKLNLSPGEPSPTTDSMTTPAADTVDLSATTPVADSASDWNGAATRADSTTEGTAMATVPADTSTVDTSMPVDTTETPSGYSERETEPAPTAGAEPDAAATTAGGNIMTGADVVTAMTRQGQQCIVAQPESDLAGVLQRDMSRTPADVNPCGLGAMIISSLATGVDAANAGGDTSDDAGKLEDEDDRGY